MSANWTRRMFLKGGLHLLAVSAASGAAMNRVMGDAAGAAERSGPMMERATDLEPSWMRLHLPPSPGDERVQTEGLSVAADVWRQGAVLPGPDPDAAGIQFPEAGELMPLEAELDRPVGTRGTLTVWFRLDRTYEASPTAETSETPLVEIEDVCSLALQSRPSHTALMWRWGASVADVPNSAVPLPRLPGPAWYHVVYQWDAEQGVFEMAINGTPMKTPGIRLTPWQVNQASATLRLWAQRLAISDVHVTDQATAYDALLEQTPADYKGNVAYLLGHRSAPPLTFTPDRSHLIHEVALADASDTAGWVMEGPGEVRFDEGWMTMLSPEEQGHCVYWFDQDLPADFAATWQVQMLSELGLCIVFFAATGRGGQSIFDPALEARDGIFPRYHSGDIDCYHISYQANPPHEAGRATSNLRKNHGFYLVDNGPPGIPPTSRDIHEVTLVKRQGRIRLAVDNRVIIDHHDDGERFGPVLGGGKFGLRQMQWTRARYRNLRVYELDA